MKILCGNFEIISLQVRLAVVNFKPETVYGSRCGYQQCLLVTANDKMNAFHKSAFWKSPFA